MSYNVYNSCLSLFMFVVFKIFLHIPSLNQNLSCAPTIRQSQLFVSLAIAVRNAYVFIRDVNKYLSTRLSLGHYDY